MSKTTADRFSKELSDVFTEHLFNGWQTLDPLTVSDSRVRYYVDARVPAAQLKEKKPQYSAERRLFALFWPPAFSPQVLNITGGAGSGKSTFVHFFFQYFLPHYEVLINGEKPDSPASRLHREAVRRHIILYADFRRMPVTNATHFLIEQLALSLRHAARKHAFAPRQAYAAHPTEDDLMAEIGRLAQETAGQERKWYISWVLDNADQLERRDQLEIVRFVRSHLPEEPPQDFPTTPITQRDGREIWRVIVPVRPQTRTNLDRLLEPYHNKEPVDLQPLDPDCLVTSRSTFIVDRVGTSTRHHHVDTHTVTSKRPGYDLATPEEAAQSLQSDMLAASQITSGQVTSRVARELLDQFVGSSARRRLVLTSRIAFSPVFTSRRATGLANRWTEPVTPFYFFDALIRGSDTAYNAHAKASPVLNLYSLGAEPTSRPRAIFVGILATWLLARGMSWSHVRLALTKLGYAENDLTQCQRWLTDKECMVELWDGEPYIEMSVVKGHWALLTERAYTDNMAVACAREWQMPTNAPQTNPLDPNELLSRVGASIWFMKRVWQAERDVRTFTEDCVLQWNGNSDHYIIYRKSLHLPYVTCSVAKEYLHRIQKLPEYERPHTAIKGVMEEWNKHILTLKELVSEAEADKAAESQRE